MASYRKTPQGKWRVEVYRKGTRTSKVFDTKSLAKSWATRIEYQLDNKQNFVSSTKTVKHLLDKYIDEVCPLLKRGDKEAIRVNNFKKYEISNYLASEITAKDIAKWRDQRLKHVSNATVNREMNTLSSIFRVALSDWEWVNINPVRGVSRPKQPKHRERRISDEEVNIIIKALNYNENIDSKQCQVALMFLIAIETGMRLGEIWGLKTKDIFLKDRHVVLHDTKNTDSRQVPLSTKAIELIDLIYPEMFTVTKGTVTTLFRRAVKKSGLINLTFHDSRHEAITRLARKLDVLDLARMIGHRDPKSLMIYYNPTAKEIASRLD